MEFPTGWQPTLGTLTGVIMASLKSSEERTTVALNQKLWLESHALTSTGEDSNLL